MRHITDLTINDKDDCCCVLEVMEPQSPSEWLSSKIPDFVATIFYNEVRDVYILVLVYGSFYHLRFSIVTLSMLNPTVGTGEMLQ